MYKPILVPTYSGVFEDLDKKTCLVFENHKYANILEYMYRPNYMCCLNQKTPFSNNLDFIIKRIYVDETDLESVFKNLIEDYNVIYHSDDKAVLIELIQSNIFDLRYRNIAISTGLIEEWSVKTLFDFVQSL
jgi:hypothetical protein